MTGEKLKVINLFLILIKLTVSKFYALSEKSKVNFSVNQYLSKIDSLLEIHAPLKKLNKKELKFLTKPWITHKVYKILLKRKIIYTQNL